MGPCPVPAPLSQSSSSACSPLLLAEAFGAGEVFCSGLIGWVEMSPPFCHVVTWSWNGAALASVAGKGAQGWSSVRSTSHNSLLAFGCPGLQLGEKDCGSVSPWRTVDPGSAWTAMRRRHGT